MESLYTTCLMDMWSFLERRGLDRDQLGGPGAAVASHLLPGQPRRHEVTVEKAFGVINEPCQRAVAE